LISFTDQGCQTASCNLNSLGGYVDQINGRFYYPDASGIQCFNLNTNITNRAILISNSQAKFVVVDPQSSLMFIQMYPVNAQPYDIIYVASLNVVNGIADPATLKPIPGALAADISKGNILSVSHCTNATCSVCGSPYVSPIPTISYTPGIQQFTSFGLIVFLIIILLY